MFLPLLSNGTRCCSVWAGEERDRMKDNVGVSIFGRAIPMEFDFEQIEPVE